MKIQIRDIFFIIISLFFTIYSQIVSYSLLGTDTFSSKQIDIFLFSLFLLSMGIVSLNLNSFKNNRLWLFLILICILSRIYNQEFIEVINLLMVCVSGIVLFRVPNKYYSLFINVLFISSVPFSIALYGKVYNTYAINTLFIFTSFIVNLNCCYKFKSQKTITIILLLFMNVLLFSTGSRTAFFASIFVSILTIFIFFYNKKIISNIIFLGTIFLTILFSYINREKINQFISSFFIKKWDNNIFYYQGGSGFFGQRGSIWKDVINNRITLLGHEELFFKSNYNLGDSHNIFIQILGIYGIIALFITVMFFLNIFFLILKKRSYSFLIFFSIYLIMGFTENIVFFETRSLLVSILFLLNVGQLYQENRKESK